MLLRSVVYLSENGVPDHVLQSRQLQIRRKVAFELGLEKDWGRVVCLLIGLKGYFPSRNIEPQQFLEPVEVVRPSLQLNVASSIECSGILLLQREVCGNVHATYDTVNTLFAGARRSRLARPRIQQKAFRVSVNSPIHAMHGRSIRSVLLLRPRTVNGAAKWTLWPKV